MSSIGNSTNFSNVGWIKKDPTDITGTTIAEPRDINPHKAYTTAELDEMVQRYRFKNYQEAKDFVAQVLQNQKTAKEYWKSNPTVLFRTYKDVVVSAANKKNPVERIIAFLINGQKGLTPDNKQKMSVYQEIARIMGYELGPFTPNLKTDTVMAQIKGPAKELPQVLFKLIQMRL